MFQNEKLPMSLSEKATLTVTPANGHDLLVTTKHVSHRYLSIVIPAIFKPESRGKIFWIPGFRGYDEKDFHTKAGVQKVAWLLV